MKKYFLLFISVLFLFSCSDEIPEEELPVRSGRTVLAYLISNNNLDSNLKDNLVDMYEGLTYTKDTCTLLVYYRPKEYDNGKKDPDGIDSPSILKFTSDGLGNINNKPAIKAKDLTVRNVVESSIMIPLDNKKHNATDPKTMRFVLEKMKELSPSESYGLIFGSHGTSWLPGNNYPGRSFGDDGGYNIDIPEMADVIGDVFNTPLDFILFDACMMGTAEVCYELKDVTNYLIGSVVETHVYGNPYDIIIPKLFEDNIRYSEICEDYIKYSKNLGAWGVCATIDCIKLDELAGWIKNNLSNYSEAIDKIQIDDIQQYGVYRSYINTSYKYYSFDIIDLFSVLNDGSIPVELNNIIEKVVVAKDALCGPGYEVVGSLLIEEEHYCGLGMYLPNNEDIDRKDWDQYYKESISWYNAAGWDKFYNQQEQNN